MVAGFDDEIDSVMDERRWIAIGRFRCDEHVLGLELESEMLAPVRREVCRNGLLERGADRECATVIIVGADRQRGRPTQ